jgi:hypothetical protein
VETYWIPRTIPKHYSDKSPATNNSVGGIFTGVFIMKNNTKNSFIKAINTIPNDEKRLQSIVQSQEYKKLLEKFYKEYSIDHVFSHISIQTVCALFGLSTSVTLAAFSETANDVIASSVTGLIGMVCLVNALAQRSECLKKISLSNKNNKTLENEIYKEAMREMAHIINIQTGMIPQGQHRFGGIKADKIAEQIIAQKKTRN